MSALRRIGETLRLMIGLPDYQRYVEHCRSQHPDKPVMSKGEFVAERQAARYGGSKMGRCC